MLEVITPCINYSDFLDITAPINKAYFDKWIIVTSPDDLETKEVCKKHSLSFIETNRHLVNGNFNRGAVINDGLNAVNRSDWVLILDADIILPDNFLKLDSFNKEFIYGVSRISYQTYEDYVQNYAQKNYMRFKDKERPIARKIAGFFQLFNGFPDRLYSEDHGGADKTDKLFGNMWGSNKTVLPHHVFHIGPPVVNWKGRISPKFTEDQK